MELIGFLVGIQWNASWKIMGLKTEIDKKNGDTIVLELIG